MQKDHGLYLSMNQITQEGKIWSTICSRTVSSEITHFPNEYSVKRMEAVKDALEK